MKKTYKKFSEAQIKVLKEYWALACDDYNELWDKLEITEKMMQKELRIPELEFFYSEHGGGIAGIGTQWASEGRKYELLQSEDLED